MTTPTKTTKTMNEIACVRFRISYFDKDNGDNDNEDNNNEDNDNEDNNYEDNKNEDN